MQNFQPSTPMQVAAVYAARRNQADPLMKIDIEDLPDAPDKPKIGPGAIALVGGLLLLGPFVVTPWIVKQFKPEWHYGKRVATGFVVSFGVGALTQIARAAGGGKEK